MSSVEEKRYPFVLIVGEDVNTGCGSLREIARGFVPFVLGALMGRVPQPCMLIILECGWSVYVEVVRKGVLVRATARNREMGQHAKPVCDAFSRIFGETLKEVCEGCDVTIVSGVVDE